jgi:putative NADH-flavin reductase
VSKVVVFGATGYAGGHIAAELVARGHEVIGVSRRPSADSPFESCAGSLFDEPFVRNLTRDADAIVIALRASGDTPLIDALPIALGSASAAGARLGIVGGAGSLNVAEGGPRLRDTPGFPAAALEESGAAAAVLDALRASDTGVDWFFLSPAAGFGSYNPGEKTGTYRSGGELLLTDADGNSNISGADYAVAFVDELESPAHHRERFSVAY